MMITKNKIKSTFPGLFLLAIVTLTLSCKKENSNSHELTTATILLTQKSWTLTSYGYDHNANGIIDASEESIRDCDKDNKYSFYINGSGLFEDNILSCGNGISEMPFTWKFINSETTIDFLTGIVKILLLNDEQLVISNNAAITGGQSARYIETFRH